MQSFFTLLFITFFMLCGVALFLNFSKIRSLQQQQRNKENHCDTGGGSCMCQSKAPQQTIQKMS